MIIDKDTPLVTDWLTAIGTVGACATALFIALCGKRLEDYFYYPELQLQAAVRRPDAEKVGRWETVGGAVNRPIGEAWYFPLAIVNSGDAPARDVQVFLKRVEKVDGAVVDKFTPMNLRWTNTSQTTRKVLLREVPAFCDFIHIGDPSTRPAFQAEDLATVQPGKGVMALDVEATNTSKGHLLEPGAYRFHLLLAAENFQARPHVVEVVYDGTWFADQGQMFDQGIGFRMRKTS